MFRRTPLSALSLMAFLLVALTACGSMQNGGSLGYSYMSMGRYDWHSMSEGWHHEAERRGYGFNFSRDYGRRTQKGYRSW